jgi:sec-independent protein translocase protein TatC
VLSRIGLVSARFLIAKLKYAAFACVIAAAVLTPTTDPGNMLVLAGPMIVLYRVGIVIAAVFGRARQDAPRGAHHDRPLG